MKNNGEIGSMLKEVLWKFPLPRTHTGIALGNAVTGLLLWGEENHLRITIGRADFWDNRGGLHWNEKQNYFDIRKYLETNNETALLDIFKTDTEDIPGQPKRPSVIPVGRIDLSLPEGAILKTGILELENAQAKVQYTRNNRDYEIKINLSMEYQRFCVEADKSLEIKPVPAWEFLGDYFKSISIEAPLIFDGGWIQDLPKNEGICIAYKKIGNTIYVLNERAENIERLKNKAIESLNHFISGGVPSLKKSNVKWWHDYWTDIPKIEIPNKTLEFCYYYGLYKFAGLTNPAGVPATLQGPWIEEYDMPPWASDYHFNINVQMCYWPAYRANRLNHLMPLFKLVWSWRNRLRKNAEAFVGIKDGFMLPHAVDDKCTCMGSFWTGMIDHACTAWIAQMMFRYVKFSNDMKFLEETAYPFMKGTMRVFEEILEKHNGSYSLPISVSPEYRGKAMNAWGENASFQLAAIHRLCEDLMSASNLLGKNPEPVWNDIHNNLPQYTIIGEKGEERIALWEGTDLEESHRHHSHLASIWPFDTVDIFAPENISIINRTIMHWTREGTGLWSGWCVPWASMLESRTHNGNMAEIYLEILTKVFMNEGYGTLHDCRIPGFSNIGSPSPLSNGPEVKKKYSREIMQIDAAMGAVTAVQDVLLHSRRGVVYIFPGVPAEWENFKFTNMPCEDGFFISAEVKDKELSLVKIESKLGGVLNLSNPWPGKTVKVISMENKVMMNGKILKINLEKHTNCILQVV